MFFYSYLNTSFDGPVVIQDSDTSKMTKDFFTFRQSGTVGIWNPTIQNLETFEIQAFWRLDFKLSLCSRISNGTIRKLEKIADLV